MANALQMTLLECYPALEMLPIDPADLADIDRAVREDEVGDTLFEFLWTEMGLADSVESAEARLSRAVSDIWDFMVAIRNQPERKDIQAMLCESCLNASRLDVDLNDLDAVQALVDSDAHQDLLFSFMWREVDDVDDPVEAADALAKAIDEISVVRREIIANLVPEPGPKH